MVNAVEFFVIFVMIVIIFMYLAKNYGEAEYVLSHFDNREYLVQNLSDKQAAADYLSSVTSDMIKLVRHLIAKYPENPEVIRLYENFDPNAVSEGSPNSGYTSYTINKKKLVLCIRQKDGTFVDKNLTIHIFTHELAHFGNHTIGHDDDFWKTFKFFLEEAVLIGIYKKEDYRKDHKDYCGIKVTSSVLYN